MRRRPAEIVDFPLDLGRGDRVGWEPPAVVLPTNLPEFPSGLSLEESSIWLRFNEAPGFTQPPYWPDFGPA
jgi:hypothetical protein